MATADSGLKGVWVDLLNPLTEDLSIHHKKLYTHVQTLGAKGVQGVVMFGHAGEGAAFSAAERLAAVKQLIQQGVSGGDILLHVGFPNVADVVHLIREATPLGLKGCVIVPPYADSGVTDQGLINFLGHIVERTKDIPARIYLASQTSPSTSDLNPRVINELLNLHPKGFAGLIDQSHNANHTLEWIRSFMALLPVYTTHDLNAHVVANLGIHSGISSYANVIAQTMVHMVTSNQASKTSVAGNKIDVEDQRLEAFDRMIEHLPEIPALKYLMAATYRDSDWLRVRPPLATLNLESQEKLSKEYKKFTQSGEAH
jgi:4-hydroxy-tetrahydrodipicolinate synthase